MLCAFHWTTKLYICFSCLLFIPTTNFIFVFCCGRFSYTTKTIIGFCCVLSFQQLITSWALLWECSVSRSLSNDFSCVTLQDTTKIEIDLIFFSCLNQLKTWNCLHHTTKIKIQLNSFSCVTLHLTTKIEIDLIFSVVWHFISQPICTETFVVTPAVHLVYW